ncbi:DNA-directed RNA polymerase sigma-70 factor [Virgisporangium aliadipatigenens]|uniref:DNA-directed RNA polymerase sigma-70 factor n=1 Tax=Virgisporangium aliadipatigenens TaxID=741659 RepID=A0A8J3YLY3_9ACTN|nr:sigma-70 family RNA polymerase sigma factor [Virgisporangium aliadipatigenens]GIJ46732.1 DNA-directed RNA polymerase sigma-70 factor [Virgisporangium aliadipatigenens]
MDDTDERLERLFRAHADGLFRYVAHRIGVEEAGDVVGDTFVVAWRKLDRIPSGDERAWLYGVARRETLSRVRKRARGDALYQRLLNAGPQDGADIADGVLARLELWRALAELGPADRDILLTTLWTELTPAEAARVLGCSRPTYAVKLHRARRRLARALEERDMSPVLESVR